MSVHKRKYYSYRRISWRQHAFALLATTGLLSAWSPYKYTPIEKTHREHSLTEKETIIGMGDRTIQTDFETAQANYSDVEDGFQLCVSARVHEDIKRINDAFYYDGDKQKARQIYNELTDFLAQEDRHYNVSMNMLWELYRAHQQVNEGQDFSERERYIYSTAVNRTAELDLLILQREREFLQEVAQNSSVMTAFSDWKNISLQAKTDIIIELIQLRSDIWGLEPPSFYFDRLKSGFMTQTGGHYDPWSQLIVMNNKGLVVNRARYGFEVTAHEVDHHIQLNLDFILKNEFGEAASVDKIAYARFLRNGAIMLSNSAPFTPYTQTEWERWPRRMNQIWHEFMISPEGAIRNLDRMIAAAENRYNRFQTFQSHFANRQTHICR